MNSVQMDTALRSDAKVRDMFLGVFPSDMIPVKEYPSSLIVNTQPSSMNGEHWVAFFLPRVGVLEAFDSYGQNPGRYSSWIKRWMGEDFVVMSNTVRQNTDSTVCGQYCMFYVLLRCYGYSYKDIMSALTRHKGVNDRFVCKFINKFFRLRTTVRDDKFIEQLLKNG